MRKYAVIYRSVVMENLQYAANIALGFVSYFVFIFVFINLWGYIYSEPGTRIAGYTRQQMIWYVMITEMVRRPFGSSDQAGGGGYTGREYRLSDEQALPLHALYPGQIYRGMEHSASYVHDACGGHRGFNGRGASGLWAGSFTGLCRKHFVGNYHQWGV